MNLILIAENECCPCQRAEGHVNVVLSDRRAVHIRDVINAKIDDSLKVGMLNGDIGLGRVVDLEQDRVTLALDFSASYAPPPSLPVVLVIALPRPKMLRRILQSCASLGVKEIWFIHSYRVEKSYWSSPLLSDEQIRLQLLLGLEQAGDTVMPSIFMRKRFKPFVEDELPRLVEGREAWLAHPYNTDTLPNSSSIPKLIAIGPEGGFIAYEVEKFKEAGLQSMTLGQRILRVETAIPVILSRMFPIS